MGYTTHFTGQFNLDKPLKSEHQKYLSAFNITRRMKRDEQVAATFADPLRNAAGLPIGKDGGYFVGNQNDHGKDRDESIINYNRPPDGQPGLWCQWCPSVDGTAIVWDEGEKFDAYTEWLKYLIEHFLAPWGYVLSGEVEWQGEDSNDRGTIFVKDTQVEANAAQISAPRPSWEKIGS